MRRFTLLLPLAFAACVEDAAPPVPDMIPPMHPVGTCAAPDLQGLVGRSAAVLQTMKFGSETRIIRPGMAVTMDYREDRLNIEIDAAEVISRVTCG